MNVGTSRQTSFRHLGAILSLVAGLLVACLLAAAPSARAAAASASLTGQTAARAEVSALALHGAPCLAPAAPCPDNGHPGTPAACCGPGCPGVPFSWISTGVAAHGARRPGLVRFFPTRDAGAASIDQEPSLPPPRPTA